VAMMLVALHERGVTDMGEIWLDFQERLAAHHDVFDPLRELMQWHFADAERIKLEERPLAGYARRPTVGLRLQLPSNKTLAIRPGWSPPRRRHVAVATELCGVRRHPVAWRARCPNG
jgi:hypothetical protein